MTDIHDELEARDLDWFAVDAEGHLGHFTTGGWGPVPKDLLIGDMEKLDRYFRRESPVRCDVKECLGWHIIADIDYADRYSRDMFLEDYKLISSRGIFSFSNYIDWKRPIPVFYFKVAIPETPLLVEQLPDEMRMLVEKMTIRDICFDINNEVHRCDLGEYIS